MTLTDTRWTDRVRALRAEPSRDVAGDGPRLGRIGRTQAEMGAQGQAIMATLASAALPIEALARDPRLHVIERVVIAGCGDSWFAGQLVAPVVEAALGVPCHAVQAYEHALWSGPVVNGGSLVIGISSGGATPAVMAALDRAAQHGAFTLGVSNTAGSPIMQRFAAALPVEASRKGWPTQSTTATVALLAALAIRLGRARGGPVDHLATALAQLPGQLDAVLAAADADAASAATRIAACPLVIVTGSGPDLAAAQVGAAKIRELAPIHAFALPLEEMHHYRLPKRGDGLIILSTTPHTRERALDTALVAEAEGAASVVVLGAADRELEELCAAAIVAGTDPQTLAGPFAGVLTCAPLHALAYHLAMRRDALGLGAAW